MKPKVTKIKHTKNWNERTPATGFWGLVRLSKPSLVERYESNLNEKEPTESAAVAVR